MEENSTVYSCLGKLYEAGQVTLTQSLPQLINIYAQALTTQELNDGELVTGLSLKPFCTSLARRDYTSLHGHLMELNDGKLVTGLSLKPFCTSLARRD